MEEQKAKIDTFGGAYQTTASKFGLAMTRPKAIQHRYNHYNQIALVYSQHSVFPVDTQHTMESDYKTTGSFITVTLSH
eukprot:5858995-Ditylum_brightwellii.AAC.1